MIKPHTSTIIFVSHFLFIEKSETANKRRQRQYDMWESVTTGPEHITRNTKWQKKHRGGAPKDLYVHANYWLWM